MTYEQMVRSLARSIVERETGAPGYIGNDEEWNRAYRLAQSLLDRIPKPKHSRIRRAVDEARGRSADFEEQREWLDAAEALFVREKAEGR